MSGPVIKVESLGKEYVIGGEKAHEAFRDLIGSNLSAPLRRFRKLSGQVETNQRFWALKDVSFAVNEGEVLGIVGPNGAGKSTLLKILSRITAPTEGRVEIRGRVASLLEVGTGFHPELTGRENICLNGAILGMSRAEIARKFDDIVAFAEIEKFLDTPVKRYSSGMYVRLAFAVAAHLEPEILVVDEVLAVGDVQFQKKCLGKMSEVAGRGRTVLFVSHNMSAIQALCEKAVLMRDGRLDAIGPSGEVLAHYLASNAVEPVLDGDLQELRRRGEGKVRFRRITFFDRTGLPIASPRTGDELNIVLEFDGSHTKPRSARVSLSFHDVLDAPLFICDSEASGNRAFRIGATDKAVCRIPRLPLTAGRYKISLFLERSGVIEDWPQDYVVVDVAEKSFFSSPRDVPMGWEGKTVLVEHEWHHISDAADIGAVSSQWNGKSFERSCEGP